MLYSDKYKLLSILTSLPHSLLNDCCPPVSGRRRLHTQTNWWLGPKLKMSTVSGGLVANLVQVQLNTVQSVLLKPTAL